MRKGLLLRLGCTCFLLSLCHCRKLLSTGQIILNFILLSNICLVKKKNFLFKRIFLDIFPQKIPHDTWQILILTALQLLHYNLYYHEIVTILQIVQVAAKLSSRNIGHLRSSENLNYRSYVTCHDFVLVTW